MSLSHWTQLLLWLAAEATALVAGAAILQFSLRSPRVGRTVWRAALTAVALVWTVELSGLRERIQRPAIERHNFVITATTVEDSDSTPTVQPTWQSHPDPVPAMDPNNNSATSLPLWIWLGGCVLLLGRFGLAHVWLGVRRRRAAPSDPESIRLIARWQSSFGLRRVQSQVWFSLRRPVAFGILRPTIALPPDFAARFSYGEREAMLAHEMAHLAADDPFWWMVSDAVVALAWWHPLVWWARRRLQSASEAAADEASVLIPGGPHALAECLVRLGRDLADIGPARALGVGGNGPRSQLAARIQRLLRGPQGWQPLSRWTRWLPQVSAVLIAAAALLLQVQTGLSGSILAALTTQPAVAEVPASLSAAVANTNQVPAVLVPASGTERVSITSGAAALPADTNQHMLNEDQREISIVQPDHGDGTNIMREVKRILAPGSRVIFDARTQSLIIIATKKELPGLEALIKKLECPEGSYFDELKKPDAPRLLASNEPEPRRLAADSLASIRETSTVSTTVAVARQVPPSRGTNSSPKLSLLARFVALPEHGSDDLGLDWLFGLAPTNNPAIELSHDWTLLGPTPAETTNVPGTFHINHTNNLAIDLLRTKGQTAILQPEQFAALLNRIESQPGVDVLTPAELKE